MVIRSIAHSWKQRPGTPSGITLQPCPIKAKPKPNNAVRPLHSASESRKRICRATRGPSAHPTPGRADEWRADESASAEQSAPIDVVARSRTGETPLMSRPSAPNVGLLADVDDLHDLHFLAVEGLEDVRDDPVTALD